jgi:hypothetical protein
MIAAEPSYSGFSQFPGFAAGAAAELRIGYLGLIAAPEFQVSPLAWGRQTDTNDIGAHYWTTMRFGVFWDAGILQAGVSNAFAVSLYPESPKIRYPLHTGLEVHLLIPDSFLNISGFAAWEHSGNEGETDRIFFGGGIGIVY